MQVSKFEVTCPKWALPREEIPIHVKIAKDITSKIEKATIDLPDCFELRDTINLSKFAIFDNRIEVHAIGKARKSEFDYFGIVISTKEPFTELKKEIPIKIKFEYNDGRSDESITYARIFRPLLEFEKAPENIVLTGESIEQSKIPISLKFTGFGEISLRAECTIGGKIVSVGTSVLDEVLRRIISEGIISDEEIKNETGVHIDSNYIQNLITELKEKFQQDEEVQQMLKDQRITKEMADMLYDLSRENQAKLMNIFYKTVEGYLIKIISDILRRNLSNNLQLETDTKIQTTIKVPSTDVTIRFFYKDVIGNEYAPIEQKIQIIDKRENPSGFDVEIPLVVTKVDESKAYKNVGMMRIGTFS
ncbi:MAG: hypothetical protein AB1608_01560 [Thermoproteota archaeon]